MAEHSRLLLIVNVGTILSVVDDGRMAARKDEQMETWQTWCMRWTENSINEVRILEFPHREITSEVQGEPVVFSEVCKPALSHLPCVEGVLES